MLISSSPPIASMRERMLAIPWPSLRFSGCLLLQPLSRGLGSNGTKNQRKPYQRFSVSSSQAP
ncbi:hypothetical protein QVM52_26445, partial [Pseudomonas mosselii]|uniref:hypothetical protein n=1 Tax=Pseudomonas mosselii TaxID=78327 RepID=UPI00352B60C4